MANTAVLTLETLASGLRFAALAGSGHRAVLDSGPGMSAPSPIEALLIAVGGCTGMDVISLLRKKRQQVTGYDLELRGERHETHPRTFTRIEIVHRVRGFALSEAALADAVRLSAEKYCSVRLSLDPSENEALPSDHQRLGEYADDLVKLVERGDPETIAMLLRRGSR